jgi:hypothetical protein
MMGCCIASVAVLLRGLLVGFMNKILWHPVILPIILRGMSLHTSAWVPDLNRRLRPGMDGVWMVFGWCWSCGAYLSVIDTLRISGCCCFCHQPMRLLAGIT